MRHRLVPFYAGLMLFVSLGWARSPAQALQLCGLTQFADTVVLSFEQDPGPRLILSTNWVQTVPNVYTLTGPGTIIQQFLPQQVFVGSGMLGNTSSSFGGNPICRITPTLAVEQADPLVVTGTAVILCVAGASSPFQVTLNVIMTNCEEPAFPGAWHGPTEWYRGRPPLQWPGQDVPLEQRSYAGDAQHNELVQP